VEKLLKPSVRKAITFIKCDIKWLSVVVVRWNCSFFMWFKRGVHSLWIQGMCFFISCVTQERWLNVIQMKCSFLVDSRKVFLHLLCDSREVSSSFVALKRGVHPLWISRECLSSILVSKDVLSFLNCFYSYLWAQFIQFIF